MIQLAQWALAIEAHYSKQRGCDTPMDIEWAKDGRTGQLFIVQARPETVHSQKHGAALRLYRLHETGTPLAKGWRLARRSPPARRAIRDPREMNLFQPGEVLITQITNPDWEPIPKEHCYEQVA